MWVSSYYYFGFNGMTQGTGHRHRAQGTGHRAQARAQSTGHGATQGADCIPRVVLSAYRSVHLISVD
ncbi:MAG: hypothetical protein IPI69_00285 [Bacteroidales bacterium]|nr:hypothetical protein [Bacteroidales bacterium]